jgi:hypothetical protein
VNLRLGRKVEVSARKTACVLSNKQTENLNDGCVSDAEILERINKKNEILVKLAPTATVRSRLIAPGVT